jgi:DNA helicase-2/ATP-dependent DNA helicase PcrA
MLTFTNKAAAEMKSRALRTAAVASDRINAGTFHSFGQTILRAHGSAVGINPDFEILDSQDQDELAHAAAASIRAPAMSLRGKWSAARITRATPTRDVLRFGEIYEELKRDEDVVDFDDLLVYSAELFEKHPEIATAYAQHYPNILVDEFQDTNAVQFAIIQALGKHASTISVFADDDQAIFQFAGADSENVHKFIQLLEATEYSLTVNYRCAANVVRHANLLIKADSQCSGRQMRADRAGGSVKLTRFNSVEEEAAEIAKEIEHRLEQGAEAETISVLVRNSHRAAHLVRALALREIPVSNWLDQSQESKERRLLKSCLAVVRDTLNARHCKRLAEFYKIQLGAQGATETILMPHKKTAGVGELLKVRALGKGGAPLADVLAAVHASVKAIDDEMAFYLDNVLEEVRAFTKRDPHFSLEHLLEELSLGRTGGAPTEGGGVKLASLHRTKGLQWPCVYIIGLENETLPDYRAVSDESISHERRLCFVGVCRAEDELTLTCARQVNGYSKDASPFLREMKLVR